VIPTRDTSFRIVKSSKDWMFKHARDTDRILSMTTVGGDLLSPIKKVHTWVYLPKTKTDLIGCPSNFYDYVFLNHTFSQYTKAKRLDLLAECFRTLKVGGRIVSIDLHQGDSEAIYELLRSLKIETKSFDKARLSKKDSLALYPIETVLAQDKLIIPNRKRLVAYLKDIGYDVKLEQLWTAGTEFVINRIFVGMKWTKV